MRQEAPLGLLDPLVATKKAATPEAVAIFRAVASPASHPIATEFHFPSPAESPFFPLVRHENPANPKEVTIADLRRLIWFIHGCLPPEQPVNFRDKKFTAITSVSYQQWYTWAKIAWLDEKIGAADIAIREKRVKYNLKPNNVCRVLKHIEKLKQRGIDCLPKAKAARQRQVRELKKQGAGCLPKAKAARQEQEKAYWELKKDNWCRIRYLAHAALPHFCVSETRFLALFLASSGYCIRTGVYQPEGSSFQHRVFAAPSQEAISIRNFLTTHQKEFDLFLQKAKEAGPDSQSTDEISLGQLLLLLTNHPLFLHTAKRNTVLENLRQYFPNLVLHLKTYKQGGLTHTTHMISTEQAMTIFDRCKEEPALKEKLLENKTMLVAWNPNIPLPTQNEVRNPDLYLSAGQTLVNTLGYPLNPKKYREHIKSLLVDNQIPYVIDNGSIRIPIEYMEEFTKRCERLRNNLRNKPIELSPEPAIA